MKQRTRMKEPLGNASIVKGPDNSKASVLAEKNPDVKQQETEDHVTHPVLTE